jgi:hypothetical protein
MVPRNEKETGETIIKIRIATLCIAVTIIGQAWSALADPLFKDAAPGTRHYRYAAVERNPGQPEGRYRVDFDLVTDANRGVTAVIRKAESAKGDVWSTPTVSADCKKALRGGGNALARITLAPMTPEAADSLGEPFMAMCAPASYFFPMTDILNVVLIQASPSFHLKDLTAVGMSAKFDGFNTKLDRLGMAMTGSSPGGVITLSALDDHVATVDWVPEPMQLTLTQHATPNSPEMTMTGFERYAFRAEIDRTTGALRRAVTTADNLDVVISMPGLPSDKAPHVAISREVAIEPRD